MSEKDDIRLLVDIAHLYYDENLTQNEIAKRYSMSRSLASKLITKARKLGIVEIIVHDEGVHPYRALEDQVRKAFELKDVHCVNIEDNTFYKKRLGIAAGKYLARRIASAKYVAVSSGNTNYEIADNFRTNVNFEDVTFVPMSGGLGRHQRNIQANVICELLAHQCGGKSLQLHAPVVVDSSEAKKILMKQFFIKHVLDKARKADVAIIGVGSSPSYFELTEAYLQGMNKHSDEIVGKIKGDISYNFYDEAGETINCKWNRQLMSLSLGEIKKIPEIIAVAGGGDKLESIYIAAKTKMMTTLVTDVNTAKQLLYLSNNNFMKEFTQKAEKE